MGELDDIYQQALRMHYEQPHNYGPLDGATSCGRATNPVCGDEVSVYLAMGPAGARAVTFDGHVCAISKASASLMTDAVVGKSATEIGALREAFGRMMRGDDAVSLGALDALKGVRRYRVRVRCALLPWEALETALKG
jgi:nitrogen fixation protein NifU and related proteins